MSKQLVELKPVTAEQVANIAQHLAWAREPKPLGGTGTLPAEAALLALADSHANLTEALTRAARVIEAMRNSKKLNLTFEQQHALEDHYALAQQALAYAEGRL